MVTKSEKNKDTNILYKHLIDGVKWTEKYNENLDNIWKKIPNILGTIVATFAVFTFGATLRGEWVIILVTALNQWSGKYHEKSNENVPLREMFTLSNLKMEDLPIFFVFSLLVSYVIYFGVGGFIHWYFYINKKDSAKEWKIQPNKWLTPELEKHELILGSTSLFVNASVSALLACYIYNGNPCTIYYKWDEYGAWWFFLQFPVVFVLIDYSTYLMHWLYHTPFLYKNFHKLHHKYKQPTVFSVTALHPLEAIHFQLTMCIWLFVIPVHWGPFYIIAIYNYYHGIIDHSGINFKALWWQPWQPDAEFHDQHHEFFHCNFGFNMSFWDTLHGTYRKKNRKYTEETFHGMDVKEQTTKKD